MGMKILTEICFFSLKKDSRTRGHEVKLVQDQCRLDIRKYSFSERTINEWNKLSMDCGIASSLNMFKNKVDTRAGVNSFQSIPILLQFRSNSLQFLFIQFQFLFLAIIF